MRGLKAALTKPLLFDKGVAMTPKKKAARLVNGTASTTTLNTQQFSIIGTPDWRMGLSFGSGTFRHLETYDHPATGRRLRRLLERKAKKGGAV